MKKPKRKTLTNKLDKLVSEIARSGGVCEFCGAKGYLNAHHIFTRTMRSVRWDLDNLICLCSKHHVFSTEFSAHGTPLPFAEWVREYRGEEWYHKLYVKAYTIKQWSDKELIELYKELNDKYKGGNKAKEKK